MSKEEFDRDIRPGLVEKERIANMTQLEFLEYKRMKELMRAKHLANAKDLKKMLAAALRDRKLLSQAPGVAEIQKNIIAEALTQIHEEIDCGLLTEIAPVIARFNELVVTPDYSHTDRTPEELEQYLKEKNESRKTQTLDRSTEVRELQTGQDGS